MVEALHHISAADVRALVEAETPDGEPRYEVGEIAEWLRDNKKASAVEATRAMYLATRDAPGTVAGVRYAYQLGLAAAVRTFVQAGVMSRAELAEGLESEYRMYGGARGVPGIVRHLSRAGWSDLEIAHAFADGPKFPPYRLACDVFLEGLHRDPAAITALLGDPAEFDCSPATLVDIWGALGYRGGAIAANCAKAGWSLDQTVAALDEAWGTSDVATTISLLARDPETPPIYLEALAGRALAGDLGLAIALRANPAARALVDRSVPTEQLTLDGPDL